MKPHQMVGLNRRAPAADQTPARRRAALERLLVYAREEAEQLQADVLVFCLDASLKVARQELAEPAALGIDAAESHDAAPH